MNDAQHGPGTRASAPDGHHPLAYEQTVQIGIGLAILEGYLAVPAEPLGAVIFAHGSGSSRHSPRNGAVAMMLQRAGFATLLLDLLTADEEAADRYTGHKRFDLGLLADRLVIATDWLHDTPQTLALPIGYFGASTGGGAALVAAVRRPDLIKAVVSRGGRPDLAGAALPLVKTPTLLIVGGEDAPVLRYNQQALDQLGGIKQLDIIPGATHLFEEPGALEQVAGLAEWWFRRYLAGGLRERALGQAASD